MISSAIKHDRMDEAAALSREADAAMRGFDRELGDVGLRGVDQALSMSDGTRFMDMWFDNIFTDLSVRNQIQSAQERTGRAQAHAAQLLGDVTRRREDAAARLAALNQERTALLG